MGACCSLCICEGRLTRDFRDVSCTGRLPILLTHSTLNPVTGFTSVCMSSCCLLAADRPCSSEQSLSDILLDCPSTLPCRQQSTSNVTYQALSQFTHVSSLRAPAAYLMPALGRVLQPHRGRQLKHAAHAPCSLLNSFSIARRSCITVHLHYLPAPPAYQGLHSVPALSAQHSEAKVSSHQSQFVSEHSAGLVK